MIQFFARVVELREEKYVKYDGKVTTDSLSREFLEVTDDLSIAGGYRIRPYGISITISREAHRFPFLFSSHERIPAKSCTSIIIFPFPIDETRKK